MYYLLNNIYLFIESLAVDLAKEQKLNYGDDLTSVLRQARKRRFQLKEEQRLAQEIELQTYLNQLIIQDADNRLKEFDTEHGLNSNDHDEVSSETTESEESSTVSAIKLEIENKKDTSIERLNNIFSKVDDRRRVSLNNFNSFFNC